MKWAYEVDSSRGCYRILTEQKIITHDDIKEREWIADVFSEKNAQSICESHNDKENHDL